MAPQKTQAIILKTLPFQETSYILHLVTQSHGLVHGIAKGVRRAKGLSFLERGFLVECLLYVKSSRDLHTMGAIQILDFFPGVRGSLLKSTVRDTAFELVMGAVHDSEPHPELYHLLVDWLRGLDGASAGDSYPYALWRFLVDFAHQMGFRLDFSTCIGCNRPIGREVAYLNVRQGGPECAACARQKNDRERVNEDFRRSLTGENRIEFTRGESLRLTRLLSYFIRYHCDVRGDLKSVEFLEQVVKETPGVV
jgi:DNA repair protein RecO